MKYIFVIGWQFEVIQVCGVLRCELVIFIICNEYLLCLLF